MQAMPMIDDTKEEKPEDHEKKEHNTAREVGKETEIVKCTSDQADPDPRSSNSEIVPSGSNDCTYPKYPNRRLTDTTTLSLSQLQSTGGGGSNNYV